MSWRQRKAAVCEQQEWEMQLERWAGPGLGRPLYTKGLYHGLEVPCKAAAGSDAREGHVR